MIHRLSPLHVYGHRFSLLATAALLGAEDVKAFLSDLSEFGTSRSPPYFLVTGEGVKSKCRPCKSRGLN